MGFLEQEVDDWEGREGVAWSWALLTALPHSVDGLTRREIEILVLLATGLANKQLAARLKISEKTVRNHLSNLYEKLGINARSQAVIYAVKKGLVEL